MNKKLQSILKKFCVKKYENIKISFEAYKTNGIEIFTFLVELNNSIIERAFSTNKLKGEAMIALCK